MLLYIAFMLEEFMLKFAESTKLSCQLSFIMFIDHQVSSRSGILYLELDVANRRVRLNGEAVIVMVGTLFA
jgi:hypothetical protein